MVIYAAGNWLSEDICNKKMQKNYLSAPLPFIGQKRMMLKPYIEALKSFDDKTVFVDLFGGSGLLSHTTKRLRPECTVVYNDYDNYSGRIDMIPRTNTLLAELRALTAGEKKGEKMPPDLKNKVIECIERHEKHGSVDYLTLSSSLVFSGKNVTDLTSLKKETLYCKVRQTDYQANGYLDGLTIVCQDYKSLFEEYKNVPSVVFLVDPPYLNTDCTTYNMSWSLVDYLDVLIVLHNTSYVYFTSSKSSIKELCQWIEKNREIGNPLSEAAYYGYSAHLNYNSTYTDMMLYKNSR